LAKVDAKRADGGAHAANVARGLRESALRELAEQPITRTEQAAEVAGAHLFAQSRRDAFQRLAARDGLLIDVEPAQLASELVNRYRAVKRAGLL